MLFTVVKVDASVMTIVLKHCSWIESGEGQHLYGVVCYPHDKVYGFAPGTPVSFHTPKYTGLLVFFETGPRVFMCLRYRK